MAADKQLIIDLTALTPESVGELAKIQEEISTDLEKSGKRKKTTSKKSDSKDANQQVKDFEKFQKEKQTEEKRQSTQDKNFKDFVKKNGPNFKGFMLSSLKTSIPQLSLIIAATTIITSIIKRIDALQKQFVENFDERVNAVLSNREQALVDANQQQIIITNGDGSTNPRNAYNSLNESDANISFSESRYSMENTSGYN